MKRGEYKKDHTGFENDNWLVLGVSKKRHGKHNALSWDCLCKSCNKEIRNFPTYYLNGNLLPFSCGCKKLKKEKKKNNYWFEDGYGIGKFHNKDDYFYFDIEDYEKINNFCWHKTNKGYAATSQDKNRTVLMHRLILGVDDDYSVDHVDHNTLDNRKKNIRVVYHDINMLNKNKYKNNSSGIPGVSWHKKTSRWVARISIDKKQVELGRFREKEDAISCRKKAEQIYYIDKINNNSEK